MELRCPDCCSPEVAPDSSAAEEGRQCLNCGARFSRESALVTVAEVEASLPDPAADSACLDRLAAFLNRNRPWSGGDVCEYLATELVNSGRELLDAED
jgi:hypothetical protein